MTEYKKRNLKAFQKPPTELINPAVLKRRNLCKRLMASEFWPALTDIADEIMNQYAAPIAAGGEELHGYLRFCLLRDGLGQYLGRISEEAKLAPKDEEG